MANSYRDILMVLIDILVMHVYLCICLFNHCATKGWLHKLPKLVIVRHQFFFSKTVYNIQI